MGGEEIFGPVLCIKRVNSFEEGVKIMNDNRFANGSVIYTQNGYYARKFAKETHGGMVGINVGIPVPVGIFGFTGQKQSFFGDLHMMGRDGFIFYTESQQCHQDVVRGRERGPRQSGHLGRHHDAAIQIDADRRPVPAASQFRSRKPAWTIPILGRHSGLSGHREDISSRLRVYLAGRPLCLAGRRLPPKKCN